MTFILLLFLTILSRIGSGNKFLHICGILNYRLPFVSFCAVLLTACAGTKQQSLALQQRIEGMRADSILMEKRILKLNQENTYLADHCAAIEQAYVTRLQEKEDSLSLRKSTITAQEMQIADMQQRALEEQQAFNQLHQRVCAEFSHLQVLSCNKSCSDIRVLCTEATLFTSNSNKLQPASASWIKSASAVLIRHADMTLEIQLECDSAVIVNDKKEDVWMSYSAKAISLAKLVLKEYPQLTGRVSTSVKVHKTPYAPTVNFNFRSQLIPCLH